MVLELREFLNEHAYTCFFTNYYFEHNGNRLNDYTELADIDLKEDPRIYMRPGILNIFNNNDVLHSIQRNTMKKMQDNILGELKIY